MEKRGVVVVTGASAGVGRATAVAFAERGFDVALLARGKAGPAPTAAQVEALRRCALVLPTDVSVFAEVDAAASRTEAEQVISISGSTTP